MHASPHTVGRCQPLDAVLEQTRQTIRSAPDTVCLERARLVTDAWRRHAHDPAPIRRARAFAHVLTHMTLDLQTNPVLAGNTSTGPRAWMLVPEHGFTVPGQAVVENPSLEDLLAGDAIPADLRAYWDGRGHGGAAGVGHLAIDAERLLSRGLSGLLADAHRGRGPADPDESAYLQATGIACQAVMDWAARYAAAATDAAVDADPVRRPLLQRMAAACRRVPAEPARNLFEALQSLVLVHLAIHLEGHGYSVSPGRLDQVLLPYYQNDEDAVQLMAAFLLKLAANSLWGSHSKTQTITLGGVDARGRDQCNALTRDWLTAWDRFRIPDPMLFLRWHEHIHPDVKQRAAELLAAGSSMPMLVGDRATAAGLEGAGVPTADAWNYCIIGCNELGIPGKLIYRAAHLGEAALLRDVVLACGDGTLAPPDTFGALVDQVQRRARQQLGSALGETLKRHAADARERPTPFTSLLMDARRPGRADLLTDLPYSHLCVRSSGFANLVNGLHAIRRLVYTEHSLLLPQLADALRADYHGHESLRHRLLSLRTWGDEDAASLTIARQWLQRRQRLLKELAAQQGAPPLLMEMVVRSLHHVEGARLGATPDGRRAGEPLADSVGPPLGTSRRGPTAVLNTVCSMDAPRHWAGGYNLNLTLPAVPNQYAARDPGGGPGREPHVHTGQREHGAASTPPSCAASGRGRAAAHREAPALQSLIEVFFASGGQEVQVATLSAATLRDAQAHPEQHADLMVRVAGFNAYFVRLSPLQQEEIVARAAAVAGTD